MKYEVEQKFPVADLAEIEDRLRRMGAEIAERHAEVDCYYNHPARDFAETDEALRLRRKGDDNRITYKGPRIDSATKTRKELELQLAAGEAAAGDWAELLGALGFAAVGSVHKRRRKAHLRWQNRRIEVSLDEVTGLGTFVELELLVAEDELDEARCCIAALAQRLALGQGERRSYLSLLLQTGGGGPR